MGLGSAQRLTWHLLAVARPPGDGELIGLAGAADGSTIRRMQPRVTAKSDAYGTSLMRGLAELAALTEVPGRLTRGYPTPEDLAANRQVTISMPTAGLRVWSAALFRVFGRDEGQRPNAPAILRGSDLATVRRDAGALGVLAAIAVGAQLLRRGERREHGVDIAVEAADASVRALREATRRLDHRLAGKSAP